MHFLAVRPLVSRDGKKNVDVLINLFFLVVSVNKFRFFFVFLWNFALFLLCVFFL